MLAVFRSLWHSAIGERPFPWTAETTEYNSVLINDANGNLVARVYGTVRVARARADFIIAACHEKKLTNPH
jgi:hypothetical protein